MRFVRTLVFVVYPGITALDLVGPNEVLGASGGYDITIAALEAGPVPTTRGLEDDTETLDWIRAIDQTTTWTTSVCTGSMLLAAAGLLDGKEATTHWASLDRLKEYGAIPTGQRVVQQGKIVTAAGVSSGIDMGLTLAAKVAGDDFAMCVQLGIEYDPQPPFEAGSLDKAPAHIAELMAGMYEGRL